MFGRKRESKNLIGRRSSFTTSTPIRVDPPDEDEEGPLRRRSVTINSGSPVAPEHLPPNLTGQSPAVEKKSKGFGSKSLGRNSRGAVDKKKRLSLSKDFDSPFVSKKEGRRSSSNIDPQLSPAEEQASMAAVKSPTLVMEDEPQISSGTAEELSVMLVQPSLAGSSFRAEFFYALRYIVEPMKMLEEVWKGIEQGNLQKYWKEVLVYWVEEHFYYFSASHELMTKLLQFVSHNSELSKLQRLIEEKTDELIETNSSFQTQLDVDILKDLLTTFASQKTAYNEIKFTKAQGVDILLRSKTLVTSLNLSNGISSELFLKNSAGNVLSRLETQEFLTVKQMDGENHYLLTTSSIAIFHKLLGEIKKAKEAADLRGLLTFVKTTVGLGTLTDDTGMEHVSCMTGRAMIDCIVQNPDKVPESLRGKETAMDKVAMAVGKAMMAQSLIIDNTSGAFNMFSATHLYSLSTFIDLSGIKTNERLVPDILSPSSNSSSPGLSAVRSPLSPNLRSPSLSPNGGGSPPETNRGPVNVDWLVDYEPSVIASCFMSLDVELMKKVDLTEMDFTGWKKAGNSKTIQKWIGFFNRTSYLVASEIVTCPWPEDRKGLIEKFVDLACILLEKRNYQSVFAIMGGLTLNCISRLTDMWFKALDSRRMSVFSMLQKFTSSKNNFKEYRTTLSSLGGDEPFIPYIGLLLQDILSIEEIPAYVKNADNEASKVLNFDRLRKLGSAKRVLRRAQCSAGGLKLSEPFSNLCEYLSTGAVCLDSDQLYRLSMKIQSKVKPKKARK